MLGVYTLMHSIFWFFSDWENCIHWKGTSNHWLGLKDWISTQFSNPTPSDYRSYMTHSWTWNICWDCRYKHLSPQVIMQFILKELWLHIWCTYLPIWVLFFSFTFGVWRNNMMGLSTTRPLFVIQTIVRDGFKYYAPMRLTLLIQTIIRVIYFPTCLLKFLTSFFFLIYLLRTREVVDKIQIEFLASYLLRIEIWMTFK